MNRLVLFLIVVSEPLFAQANFCPGAPESAEKLVASRMAKFEKAFENSSQPMFFIGLWSRIEERERRRLSTVMARKKDDEVVQGLREVMGTISAKLSEDRREFATWTASHALGKEIEVQSIPVDGSFLLVRASRKGIQQVLCASASGELPSLLTELGF